jgi:SPP1 gp7 family putative phage head morphogenesis protein
MIPINRVQLGIDRNIRNCSHLPTAASSNKLLDELSELLAAGIWEGENTDLTEASLIVEETKHLAEGLKSGYGTFVAYNTPDVLAYQLMEYNLFEFSASKTEARLAAMTDLLIDKKKQQIRSFSEFKELAMKEVKSFNADWLLTEYNLSIAVGQSSAAYHRFKAEEDTVTQYVQYQTVGDTKVRDQHALLNGKVFSLKDKEAMQLWPPNGYGCRCEMIQFIHDPEEVMSGAEGKRLFSNSDMTWKDSQFAINRGDLKEVFTTKQFYSKRGIDGKFSDLTYDKHKLPSWNKFKSDLNPLKLDDTITADNVSELFKPSGKIGKEDFMGFDDYFGRKLILNRKTFDIHTKGKYLKENRHKYFPHVKDILENPDEVWLINESDNKFQTLRYVKFYKDKTLVVTNRVSKNHVEIKTWYEMKDEKKTRTGLLINKKS